MDWLSKNALNEEFDKWPAGNRNKDDYRFGQYLCTHYKGVPDEVFMIEDLYESYYIVWKYLDDVQR